MAEKRETKGRLELCCCRKKSVRLTLCACELFLNRDLKSYGDKSPPRHTNSTIYNRKGSLFLAPAYLILLRWMQSAGQYFLIQRRNRSKAVIQRKKKKSFKGSRADWVEGAAADCALPCKQALAGTTRREKKGKSQEKTPFFLFLFLLAEIAKAGVSSRVSAIRRVICSHACRVMDRASWQY